MIRNLVACFILCSLGLILFSGQTLWMNVRNMPEMLGYNTALFLGKWGFSSLALPLVPPSFSGYDDRMHELRGDLLFALGAHTGETLEAYYAARNIASNHRLETKIAFLEAVNTVSSGESAESTSPVVLDTELEITREHILRDQEIRSEFLNPYRTQGEKLEQDIWHLRQRLSEDTLTEYKDW